MREIIRDAEYKLKIDGVKWDDCPIVDTLPNVDQQQAEAHAQRLLTRHNKQVRWNWKGYQDGHYTAEPPA